MNRKPTRAARRRRHRAPDWVALYRDQHQVPEYGTDAYADLIGWLYMGEPIPGLPEADSLEACALIDQARSSMADVLSRSRVVLPKE